MTTPEGQEGQEARKFNEGDIYFWSWKDAGLNQYAYHCYAQKAVVVRGLLIDTYWHDRTSDRAINPAKVNLTFKGNESTLRKINSWDVDYYDPDDVVDMRHANASCAPVYVLPSAVRSKDIMLELIRYKRERAESDIRSAKWRLERLADNESRILRGTPLSEIDL